MKSIGAYRTHPTGTKIEGYEVLFRCLLWLSAYTQRGGTPISRAQAEERMSAKLAALRFMADIRPLLSPDRAELLSEDVIRRAFFAVFMRLISIMPGASWAKTSTMKKKFGID